MGAQGTAGETAGPLATGVYGCRISWGREWVCVSYIAPSVSRPCRCKVTRYDKTTITRNTGWISSFVAAADTRICRRFHAWRVRLSDRGSRPRQIHIPPSAVLERPAPPPQIVSPANTENAMQNNSSRLPITVSDHARARKHTPQRFHSADEAQSWALAVDFGLLWKMSDCQDEEHDHRIRPLVISYGPEVDAAKSDCPSHNPDHITHSRRQPLGPVYPVPPP